MTLVEWLIERADNCARIGRTKFGTERNGWAEDEAYFRQAIDQLSRVSYTQKSDFVTEEKRTTDAARALVRVYREIWPGAGFPALPEAKKMAKAAILAYHNRKHSPTDSKDRT